MPHQSPQNLFPVIHRHVWLNHAAISAWPTPVIEALRGFVEENANHGSSRYELWLESEQALRQAIADLITAPQAEDITLVRNTSEAINIVAQGIPWADGDEVLVLSNEFPSNLLPWINLKDRGVIVRLLTKHNQDSNGRCFFSAI
jgi:cysteine desulfurase/selenocysteine lyase